MEHCIIPSPLGFTKIVGNEHGIASISILNSEEKPTDIIPVILEDSVQQLLEYFEGTRTAFELNVNLEGTDFQKKVWNALQTIPFGKTLSYLQLSQQLGDVKAIRAVANANGKNPLWIVVPCHRVIGSDVASQVMPEVYRASNGF